MALLAVKAPAGAAEAIIVQSTTSTQNAGFYRHVLPAFTAETGITVKAVAVGTGQALKNAQNCDGDMLIVHARAAEEAFIDAGYGAARYNLMYNDFIIVGPQRDPAGLRYAADAREAMRRIQRVGARFASRGDESGTHKKEQDLWRAIGTNPEALSGSWYLETGSGMGATLNFSVQSDSHALTDRATWLSFANKFRHRILFEGDPRLFNQYGIVTLDPGHCPTANHEGAMRFADWLLSPDGQERIGSLTRKGEQLLFPTPAHNDRTVAEFAYFLGDMPFSTAGSLESTSALHRAARHGLCPCWPRFAIIRPRKRVARQSGMPAETGMKS